MKKTEGNHKKSLQRFFFGEHQVVSWICDEKIEQGFFVGEIFFTFFYHGIYIIKPRDCSFLWVELHFFS